MNITFKRALTDSIRKTRHLNISIRFFIERFEENSPDAEKYAKLIIENWNDLKSHVKSIIAKSDLEGSYEL